MNASNLLNFDSLYRFLPIASQSWCSGVSKMATYIYISCRFICSKISQLTLTGDARLKNKTNFYQISITAIKIRKKS